VLGLITQHVDEVCQQARRRDRNLYSAPGFLTDCL